MHRTAALLVLAMAASLASCADTKPPGPTTDTSSIPWNRPENGMGGGQLGMLPQNQYRR